MNGEENSSLLRTLCTASQKGKQDLVFTGVILGNREIDCQIFILSECVCQLAAIVCWGHCVPCQHYTYALNTGKVLTLAVVHVLHISSRLDVCSIMKQAARPGRKIYWYQPSLQKMLTIAVQSPETQRSLNNRTKDEHEIFQDLYSPVPSLQCEIHLSQTDTGVSCPLCSWPPTITCLTFLNMQVKRWNPHHTRQGLRLHHTPLAEPGPEKGRTYFWPRLHAFGCLTTGDAGTVHSAHKSQFADCNLPVKSDRSVKGKIVWTVGTVLCTKTRSWVHQCPAHLCALVQQCGLCLGRAGREHADAASRTMHRLLCLNGKQRSQCGSPDLVSYKGCSDLEMLSS